MAMKIIDDSYLVKWFNAVRAKRNETSTYTVDEFEQKIKTIPSGSSDLGPYHISENGTYVPSDVQGWNRVTVNVPAPYVENAASPTEVASGKRFFNGSRVLTGSAEILSGNTTLRPGEEKILNGFCKGYKVKASDGLNASGVKIKYFNTKTSDDEYVFTLGETITPKCIIVNNTSTANITAATINGVDGVYVQANPMRTFYWFNTNNTQINEVKTKLTAGTGSVATRAVSIIILY